MNNDLIKKMLLDKANTVSTNEALTLGLAYYEGKGVKKDDEIAFKFFERAALKGHAIGMYMMFIMYSNGEGVAKNTLKALDNLKKSSERGCERAIYELGELYYAGKYVEQDYKKAFNYFLKVSSKMDDAMQMLGWCYEQGQGVEVNYKKALECYLKASKKGNVAATYNLGCMYDSGKGVEVDYKKALEYFKKGIEKNHLSSIYNVGCFYYAGMGVERDYKIAAECFSKAASMGHLGAQCNLATMKMNGLGMKKDIKKAIKMLKELSDKRDEIAKCNLAILIINKFIEEDVSVAKKLLEEVSASSGYKKVVKLYTLACYEQYCLDGNIKSIESVTNAINNHLEIIKLSNEDAEIINWQYMRGIKLAIVYEKLAECYLDMYYLSQVNIGKRSKSLIIAQEKYRQEAKKYLDLANESKSLLSDEELKFFKSEIAIYENILDDSQMDWNKITLKDFQLVFEQKFPNIFLNSTKKKSDIFNECISRYFEKRAIVEKTLKDKANSFEEDSLNRYSKILKNLKDNNVEDADKKLINIIAQRKQELEKYYMVDFSDCVVSLDKYLEETLHNLFITSKNESIRENLEEEIDYNINQIETLAASVNVDVLRQVVSIIHNSPVNLKFTDKDCVNKIKDFVVRFNKITSNKQFPVVKMGNLKQSLENNDNSFGEDEKKFIKNILRIGEARWKLGENIVEEDFTMGQLFHTVFIENTSTISSTKRIIDKEIFDFICVINPNMDKRTVELKINELISKVELFRVIVRNVASHENELNQKCVEDGFSICMLQENSIFSLIEDLFGKYIQKKWIKEEFIKPILAEGKSMEPELSV